MDAMRKRHDALHNPGAPEAAGPAHETAGKIRGRMTIRKGPGCLVVLLMILMLVIGCFWIYPLLTPDKIRGEILDCAVVPQKDSTSRLWILANGSFEYIASTKTPGSYSVGRKCLFCKAWLYEYDPVRGKVIRKIKIPYDDIIISAGLFYGDGRLTLISGGYAGDPPKIISYDAFSGTMIEDTAGFTAKHPELSAGITAIRRDREKNILSLDTRDGKTQLIYGLAEKKLYPSHASYNQEKWSNQAKAVKGLLCAENGQEARRLLYRITAGNRDLLWYGSTLESRCNPNVEKISSRIPNAEAKRLSDTVFLQGTIYHQDQDGVLIIHANQVAKKADRMMTLVDREGKTKWNVAQSDLFDQMKIDEDKGYPYTFSGSKNKIRIIRSGALVVLTLEGLGIMGFDYATGQKLFTLD